MSEGILYEDGDFRFSRNIGAFEHVFYIKGPNGAESRHVLPLGSARRVVSVSRNCLEKELNKVDSNIGKRLKEIDLSFDSAGLAILKGWHYFVTGEKITDGDYCDAGTMRDFERSVEIESSV